MKDLFEQFSQILLSKPHLKPVLPVNPKYISFQTEKDFLYLKISSQDCELFSACQERTDIWIKGEEEAIISMLVGQERLRKLESRNEIKITGSFKDILLLESLFTLCTIKQSA
jgi:hypothetical protein